MALPQLTDLLTIPSQDDVLNQEVMPELTKRGARVTDWTVGGVYRAMAYVVALMRMNARQALASFAAAGFEQYAFGFSPSPVGDVTGWAPLVALNRYGVAQKVATRTQRTITLTNTTGTSYGPLSAGAIIIAFPSGNRYLLAQTVTIPANGSVQATFQSEFLTNSAQGLVYNDAPGSTLSLVTANYPGVTATNPAPTYSPVTQSGSGVGTVTPSGSPTSSPHTVAVKITNTGTVSGSTVTWQTALDGGAWTTQSGSSVSNLGGTGINITLADNGGSPSFINGTVYYFSTPGSDITVVGADAETPQALGTRCQALWPSLAFAQDANGNWIPTSPTSSAYAALAISANSQVVVAFPVTDATVNNLVKLYIAGQGGAVLPTSVVSNVQSFFNSRSMLTDSVTVLSPTARAVTLAGMTITVKVAQLATAQAALQLAYQKYLGGVDPNNALGINGRIDHAYLIELARGTSGVTQVTDTALTISVAGGGGAVASDVELPVVLGEFDVATWSQQVATAFTWLTV